MFGEFPRTSTISTVNSHHRSLIQIKSADCQNRKTPTGSLQTLANWVSTAEYSPDLQVVYSLAFHHTNPVRWCQRRVIHLTSMQISQGKKWHTGLKLCPPKSTQLQSFDLLWKDLGMWWVYHFSWEMTQSFLPNQHHHMLQPTIYVFITSTFFDKSWTDSPPNWFKTTLGGIPYY